MNEVTNPDSTPAAKQQPGEIRTTKCWITSDGCQFLVETEALRHELSILIGAPCVEHVFEKFDAVKNLIIRIGDPKNSG